MTKEEVVKKYGNVKLLFSSYYKYSFTFEGIAPDGVEISAGFGGCPGEIYRTAVSRDKEIPLSDPTEWEWEWVTIEKEGKEIFKYYSPW